MLVTHFSDSVKSGKTVNLENMIGSKEEVHVCKGKLLILQKEGIDSG